MEFVVITEFNSGAVQWPVGGIVSLAAIVTENQNKRMTMKVLNFMYYKKGCSKLGFCRGERNPRRSVCPLVSPLQKPASITINKYPI
jgi:hypothetical protein